MSGFRYEVWRGGRNAKRGFQHNTVTKYGALFFLLEYLPVGMLSDASGAIGGTLNTQQFYIGLLAASGYTGISHLDERGSHAGWTENTSYDEVTRPAYSPGPGSRRTANNSPASGGTLAEFTFNSTQQIRGFFLTNSATKSEIDAQTFLAVAALKEAIELTSGDILKVYYSLKINARSGVDV